MVRVPLKKPSFFRSAPLAVECQTSYFKCDRTSRSFTPSSFITASLWHVREANVFFPGLPPLLKESATGKAINYLEVKYCLFVITFVIHKLIFLRLNHPCSFWVCLDLLLRREWMFQRLICEEIIKVALLYMHPGSAALCLESTMQSKTKTIITVEPPVSDYPKCQAKWSLMEQDLRPYSVNIFLIRI